MVKTPNEVNVLVRCSRCDKGILGYIVRNEYGIQTLGFGLPMGQDTDGKPLIENFKDGEVALCQDCMDGKEPVPVEPKGKIIVEAE